MDINLHVDSYDDVNHALAVHFSATVDGVDYFTPSLSYDVVSFNSPHRDEILKELAKHGEAHINIAIAKYKHSLDSEKVNNISSLANTVHTFNIQDLFPRQSSPALPDWVPPVDPNQEVGI